VTLLVMTSNTRFLSGPTTDTLAVSVMGWQLTAPRASVRRAVRVSCPSSDRSADARRGNTLGPKPALYTLHVRVAGLRTTSLEASRMASGSRPGVISLRSIGGRLRSPTVA
jgi:hypothetical protein